MTTFPPIHGEARRAKFDVHAWRSKKHSRRPHEIFTHYHPWGPCTNQHCTVLAAMNKPPMPPHEPFQEDPLIEITKPKVRSARVIIDPCVEEAQFEIGGAGAVLKPMYRKRNFLGLGGMPYNHKILMSTKNKAHRQRGSCFVANLEGSVSINRYLILSPNRTYY